MGWEGYLAQGYEPRRCLYGIGRRGGRARSDLGLPSVGEAADLRRENRRDLGARGGTGASTRRGFFDEASTPRIRAKSAGAKRLGAATGVSTPPRRRRRTRSFRQERPNNEGRSLEGVSRDGREQGSDLNPALRVLLQAKKQEPCGAAGSVAGRRRAEAAAHELDAGGTRGVCSTARTTTWATGRIGSPALSRRVG